MKQKRINRMIIALALVFAIALSLTGVFSMVTAATPKKAVYILPGFMESRLFSKKLAGVDLWFGPGLVSDIALDAIGTRPEMANDSTGQGMSAYADRNIDKLGLFGLFTPMITSINASLTLHGMHDTYTVEFFSYNWLQDLNTTAKELAADMKAKGYQSVIFVTHSNGGLLASTFIGQSSANKKMVEKTIMLAPPLWGTLISLEGMETGGVNLFDGTALMGLANIGYDIFVKPISKNWVKSWARSGPNMYQLTAGNEYVQRVPLFYQTTSGMRTINNPADYYALLKSSPSTNNSLVDGNARSLKYLRETVFKKDVLSLWEGMDLTLIGCDYGFITATSAIYRQVGTKAIYAGTIYSKAGDWVVPGISMNGDGRFPYVNLPGAQHVLIFNDPRALFTVNQLIAGGPLSNYTAYESSINQTSSISPTVGMSDMARVTIMSSDPLEPNLLNSGLSVNVLDSKGRIVAKAAKGAQTGFSENNFVYQAWDTSEYDTNILTYIPLNGYSLEVFSGNSNRLLSSIKVITEGLDASGAVLSRNEYKLTGANLLTGSIFTLNGGKSLKPEPKSGVSLTAVSAKTFNQDWRFESDTVALVKGNTFTPSVIGPDASKMVMNQYDWYSSNTSVATVSASGLITAKAPGTVLITAAARDESYKYEPIRVTVGAKVSVSGVSLDKTAATIPAGGSESLMATVKPDNASDKAINWSSSNAKVAVVDGNGIVTAIASGTATITAKTVDVGKSAICKVTVPVIVTGVALNKAAISIKAGKTETLKATVAPSGATDKTVQWSSSDSSVATVDGNGKVKAVSGGTADITAVTTDGGYAATCKITVS